MISCLIAGCAKQTRARGMCVMHYARWRVYKDPFRQATRSDGHGTVTAKGYIALKKDGVTVMEHVAIAERALGKKLPAGACVHHVDEHRANNSNSNLVICPSQAYHTLLHLRQRALDAGFPANFRVCGICSAFDDPQAMLHRNTGPHGSFIHRECRRAYDSRRDYPAERRARRETA